MGKEMNNTVWFLHINHLIILLVLLTNGCSAVIPVGKYDVLAGSGNVILDSTSETYTRIEKIQKNQMIEQAGIKSELKRDTFLPIIEVDGKKESFDITPELQFREDALQVLVNYTDLLQAFAKNDFEGDVDVAAEEFAGSVKSLVSTADPNNENAQKVTGILATVIDVIGREIVRKERLDGLKKIMDSAQPSIVELASLIADDNKKIKEFVKQAIDTILRHKNTQRPPINTIQRTNFDTDVSQIVSEADEVNVALESISGAIGQIPPAHDEIRKLLDEKPRGFEALQQLVKEVQRIDKFYRTVK
jgi:hypothetical protein